MSTREPSAAEIAELVDTLKRCSPATAEAACQYRRTHDPAHLDAVVRGVIERYVERGLRPKLATAADGLRLVEDLGFDSLTLMEIVLLLEDALRVSVSNEELLALRTIGDVRRFVASKAAAVSPQTRSR